MMQETVAAQQVLKHTTPIAADHRVYALFTHRQPHGDQVVIQIGDLRCDATRTRDRASAQNGLEEPARVWLPDQIIPAIRGRYAKETIWEDLTAPLSDSLFPHVQNIVNGQKPEFLTRYKLTNRALDLLAKADLYEKDTPREDRHSHELILHLPKASAARLAQAGVKAEAITPSGNGHDLRSKIERVELFNFRSGVIVTAAAVEVQPLTRGRELAAAELREAV